MSNRLYFSFPKQDRAFLCYDTLCSKHASASKLFSFESHKAGRRGFLVTGIDLFVNEYCKLNPLNKHYYEIIREEFPCRLYFDLEFSIECNKNLAEDNYRRANEMTLRWIQLVAWKIFELYQIQIDSHNIVVLDSTTPKKFSKHVVIILLVDNKTKQTELLFQNNKEVGHMVNLVLMDISIPFDGIVQNEDNVYIRVDKMNRIIKPEFYYLFVLNTDGKKVCFIDTAVYSKNRAFRIFGSCKYGKSKCFELLGNTDGISYPGIHLELSQSIDDIHKDENTITPNHSKYSKQNKCSRVELYKKRLFNSFVVPMHVTDINCNRTTEICLACNYQYPTTTNVDEASNVEFGVLSKHHELYTTQLLNGLKQKYPEHSNQIHNWFKMSEDVNQTEMNHELELKIAELNPFLNGNTSTLPLLKPIGSILTGIPSFTLPNTYFLEHHQAPTLPSMHLLISYVQNIYGNGDHMNLPEPSEKRNASNYTSVEHAAIDLISKSTYANQLSWFPCIDAFIMKHCASVGGIHGFINNWQIYLTNHKLFPRIKIKYGIGRNRWCANIGRSHASNGIIWEVDLMSHEVVQSCWDAECNGCKSPPILLSVDCVPDFESLMVIVRKYKKET